MSDYDSVDYSAYESVDESDYATAEDYALESEIAEQSHEIQMEIIDNMDGTDDYSYETVDTYDTDGIF